MTNKAQQQVDKLMQHLPSAVDATLKDLDGNVVFASVPVDITEGVQEGLVIEGDACVTITIDDGSNYTVIWPVESVEQSGSTLTVHGSKGTAVLSRRQS